ncbi:MAG: MarR family transcriptional regulator [Hyphomicrobiales bacterium]|nr:MarR family transcriptional regulator [Hyphomicrobiales bacterium]
MTRVPGTRAAAPSPAAPVAADDDDALDPGLLADFIGPRVRMLWNLLDARMVEALAPFGLRSGSFSALALISANPGCSQSQLARGLSLDKSAVVAVVDELEARGLARRVRQIHDRRLHALSLTANGKALLRQMLTPAAQAGRPIRETLSPRELAQLMTLLHRACTALLEAEPIRQPAADGTRSR